jgi:hypothetical protein
MSFLKDKAVLIDRGRMLAKECYRDYDPDRPDRHRVVFGETLRSAASWRRRVGSAANINRHGTNVHNEQIAFSDRTI